MGVPELWDHLNPAAVTRALTHLCVEEGFERNRNGRRTYTIGIDASIWYQHSGASKAQGDTGPNPELRNLFFKLKSLAREPILPVFVFDGRERPKIKRNSKMGKSGSHSLTAPMKDLIELFGWQWVMARGEAEAELAQMELDAVMSDDVDTFLFGANCVIKNMSLSLSGNKAHPALDKNGKPSAHHVNIYTAEAIERKTTLTRGGMILFALLCGGDYDKVGVKGCGSKIAFGLAQAGYGDELLQAYIRRESSDFRVFLTVWRDRMNAEVHSNASGKLGRKSPSLNIPNTFPNVDILDAYVNPIRHTHPATVTARKEMNLPAIAAFCEKYFTDWKIMERMRSLIWPSAVTRVLLRAAVEGHSGQNVARWLSDSGGNSEDSRWSAFVNQGDHVLPTANASPPHPHPLITEIVGSRNHASTDELLEFRVVVSPIQLVELVRQKIMTSRDAEQDEEFRLWIPAAMMQEVHPLLVDEFFDGKEKSKGKSKAKTMTRDAESLPASSQQTSSSSQSRSTSSSLPQPKRKTTPHPIPDPSSRSIFIFAFPDPTFDDMPDDDSVRHDWAAMFADSDVGPSRGRYPSPSNSGRKVSRKWEADDDSDIEVINTDPWESNVGVARNFNHNPIASNYSSTSAAAASRDAFYTDELIADGDAFRFDDDDFAAIDGRQDEEDAMDSQPGPSNAKKRDQAQLFFDSDGDEENAGDLFGEGVTKEDYDVAMDSALFKRILQGKSGGKKAKKQKATAGSSSRGGGNSTTKGSGPGSKSRGGERGGSKGKGKAWGPTSSQTTTMDVDPGEVFYL